MELCRYSDIGRAPKPSVTRVTPIKRGSRQTLSQNWKDTSRTDLPKPKDALALAYGRLGELTHDAHKQPGAPRKGAHQGATDRGPRSRRMGPAAEAEMVRWSTYNRHVERYHAYEDILDRGTSALVAKLMGRSG
jgi:hypothetical protein